MIDTISLILAIIFTVIVLNWRRMGPLILFIVWLQQSYKQRRK